MLAGIICFMEGLINGQNITAINKRFRTVETPAMRIHDGILTQPGVAHVPSVHL